MEAEGSVEDDIISVNGPTFSTTLLPWRDVHVTVDSKSREHPMRVFHGEMKVVVYLCRNVSEKGLW